MYKFKLDICQLSKGEVMKNDMNQSLGKISVIIPVYNVEAYLERCLNSILCNTYSNLEVICVNDGSTDNSLEILEKIAKTDVRVKILNKKNGGVSSARNAALKVATGEFIVFVDSDDWLHSRYFEVMYKAIKENSAEIVVCEEMRINEPVEKTYSEKYLDRNKIYIEEISLEQCVKIQIAKKMVWGKIYRKEILENLMFDEKLHLYEDTIFNLSTMCRKKKCKLVYVHEKLYYYYIRESSATHTLAPQVILPAIDSYLSVIQQRTFLSQEGEKIFVLEAVKALLAYRYLCMFEKNKKEIKNNFRNRKNILQYYMKGISFKEKAIYKMFLEIPYLYRTFRILEDKTLLDWERQKKQQRRNKNL